MYKLEGPNDAQLGSLPPRISTAVRIPSSAFQKKNPKSDFDFLFYLDNYSDRTAFGAAVENMTAAKERLVFSQQMNQFRKPWVLKSKKDDSGRPYRILVIIDNVVVSDQSVYQQFSKLIVEYFMKLELKVHKKALLSIETGVVKQYEEEGTLPNTPFLEEILLRKGLELEDEDFEPLLEQCSDFYDGMKEQSLQIHNGDNLLHDPKHNIYRNTDLAFLYVFSGENRLSLTPKVKETVEELETDDLLLDNDDLFQLQDERLTLTMDGKQQCLLLLSRFFMKLLEEGKLGDQPYDHYTPNGQKLQDKKYLLRRAYETLCEQQETHFKKKKNEYKFPYAFSEWGMNERVSIPRMLPLSAQSMATLTLTTEAGSPECTACKEGTEVFYGRGYLMGRLPREEEKGNHTGLCVKLLDSLLKEAGILDEEKGQPWYVNFIGTWQQAERRLKKFEEVQEKLRLSGSALYNFIDYYSKKFILYVDVAIKKLFDISTAARESIEEETDSWAKTYLGEWGGTIYEAVKKVLKVAGLMFYKMMSLILQSPFMFEIMVKYIKEYYDDICISLAVKNTEQTFKDGELLAKKGGVDLLRTKGSVVERFFYEEGRWVTLNKEEKEKKAKEASGAWYGALSKQANSLFSVMGQYVNLGKWQKTVDAAEFVNSKSFDSFLAAFEGIPIFGSILKKIGPDSIKASLVSYVTIYGNDMITKIIQQNRKIDRMIRLFVTFYYRADSCLNKGSLTVKDGMKFGDLLTAKFATAFHHATFNVPYYAIIILCEEAMDKKNGKSRSVEVLIEELIHSSIVGATDSDESDIKEMLLANELWAMKKEHQIEYEKSIDPYRKGTRIENVFEARKIEAVNVLAMQKDEERIRKKTAAKEWERKKWLYATGAAVVVGGVLCATNPACAAYASYAASTAVGVAKTAAVAVFQSAKEAWDYCKDNIKDLTSGVKERVERAMAWIKKEGPEKVKAAFDMAVKAGLYAADKAKDYPDIAMMTGTMIYKGGKELKEWWKNRNIDAKHLCLVDVLKQSRVNDISFRLRLKDMITRFRGKPELFAGQSPADIQEKYVAVQGMLLKKESILVQWVPDGDFLNLDEVQKFFVKYGKAETTLD